jgi:tetratricopeptide (TPR) repeat protein
MTGMLESGRVLAARYALLRKIGAGRSGETWLARDRVEKADVALKFLAAEARSPAARERFQHAAALQFEFDHPRLVRCLGLLEIEGRPGLALDYAAGGDARRLRGRPWRELRAPLRDLADALAALHARGYAHRDVKASNVVLDEQDRALLTDFELALPFGERDVDRSGTPLSASPQQLAGEPASQADDAYAFGAMVCELVLGYPPLATPAASFLFDPPVRAGVPADVVALVRECLAEDPGVRPLDFAVVRERIDHAVHDVSEPAALPPPATLRPPADADAPLAPTWQRPQAAPDSAALRREGFRRGLLVASFGTLVVAAAVVFFALPRWVAERPATTGPAAAKPTTPAATAASPEEAGRARIEEARRAAEELAPKVRTRLDNLEKRGAGLWGGERFAAGKAGVAAFEQASANGEHPAALERLRAADADLQAVEKALPAQLAAALAAGSAALERGDVVEATARFQLAQRIEPGNAAAARGLARGATAEQVRVVVADALRLEGAGQAEAAIAGFRKALQLDPDARAARDGLARLAARGTATAHEAAIARGLAAQSRGDLGAARASFNEALRLRPDSAEAREGLAQLERAAGDEALAGLLARAESAERAERWRDALASYREALGANPNLLPAQRGLERVEPRAQLEAELESYLSRPERLFSQEVRAAARTTVRGVAALPAPNDVLRQQSARLTELLSAAETPVKVALASDNLTSVTIYRIGQLGAFDRREMELLPGRYTVVGTRSGYRDVRREVTVLPGRAPGTVEIRCEEPI